MGDGPADLARSTAAGVGGLDGRCRDLVLVIHCIGVGLLIRMDGSSAWAVHCGSFLAHFPVPSMCSWQESYHSDRTSSMSAC